MKIGETRVKICNTIQLDPIKRVRVVGRADGYYVQICLDLERAETYAVPNKMVGIDVGLNYRYTNSNGNQVGNLRFLGKGEKGLKHLNRRLRRKKKGSNDRTKARNHVGRGIGSEVAIALPLWQARLVQLNVKRQKRS